MRESDGVEPSPDAEVEAVMENGGAGGDRVYNWGQKITVFFDFAA